MKKSALQGLALISAMTLSAISTACYTQTVSTSHPPVTVEGPAPQAFSPIAAPSTGAVQLPPSLPALSPGVAEIVKLAQSQLGEETMLNFINESPQPINPTAEELVFLADIGVSTDVINALIRKSGSPLHAADVSASAGPTFQSVPQTSLLPERPSPVAVEAPPVVQTPPAAQAMAPIAEATAPAVIYTAAPEQVELVEQPQQVVYLPAQQAETQTVVYEIADPVAYFQPSLAPYGTWVDVAPYGLCWQPTVATLNVNWQPYGDRGRWLDTDYGWYWQSDYSWGWAPFHYGRWHRHNHRGWVWTPGRHWGPAWVSWRRSDAYCGWAPLPPYAHYRSGFGFSYHNSHVGIHFDYGLSSYHYTYLPLRHLHSHHPYHHYADRHRAHIVHNQTHVINHHHEGRSGAIFNRGVPRDEIARLTRQEIPRVRVLDRPDHGRSVVQPDRLVKNGADLAIYRGAPNADASGSNREPRGSGNGARRSETGRSLAQGGSMPPTIAAQPSPGANARQDAGAPVRRSTVSRAPATASNARKATSRATVPGSSANSTQTQGSAPILQQNRPTPSTRSRSGQPSATSARTRDADPRQSGQPETQGLAVTPPRPIISTPDNPRIAVGGLTPPTPVTSAPGNPRVAVGGLSAPSPVTSVPSNPRIVVGGLTPPSPVTSQPSNPALPNPVLSAPQPVTSAPQRPASPAPLTILRSPGGSARPTPQIRPVPSATRAPSPSAASVTQLSVTSSRGPRPSPSVPTPSRSEVQRARPSSASQPATQFSRSSSIQNPAGAPSRVQGRTPVYSTQSSRTASRPSAIQVAPQPQPQTPASRPSYSRPTPSQPTYSRPTISPSPSRSAPSRPTVSPSISTPSRSAAPTSRSTPSRPSVSPSRSAPSRPSVSPSRSAPSQPSASPSRSAPSRPTPPSRSNPDEKR